MIKKYLTIGEDNLANRDKWLEKTLLSVPKGTKIIDVGAGETKYRKFCTDLQYTSQDFGQYTGTGNDEGFQKQTWDNTKLDIISDITDIPVPNDSFDTAMCIEVFEHIPEPINALHEISRILKPGGKLILTLPFCSQTHFAPYFFYTGFSKYWLEKYLTLSNFIDIQITPNGNWFDYIAQDLRRIHRIRDKYVREEGRWSFIIGKIVSLPVLLYMQYLNNRQNRSEELLCYGYNVTATKKTI